ncbi:uncharacterized protein HKW66_Vig0042030 [Vigna angularis]|uniref:Uncharacterized protein n=1 Tax=Phaseolus angularis TaxID=3914 RepID=A0A8T0L1H7_PHAAN|nr:uncharacterized protein HKW66_Vig0042030 [Vigna angularis]
MSKAHSLLDFIWEEMLIPLVIIQDVSSIDKRPLKMKKVEAIKDIRPAPTRPILANPKKKYNHSTEEFGEGIIPSSPCITKPCKIHHFHDSNATFLVNKNAHDQRLLRELPAMLFVTSILVIGNTTSFEDVMSQVVMQSSVSMVMTNLYATVEKDTRWYLKLLIISEVPSVEEQLQGLTEIPYNPQSTTTSPPQQVAIQSLEETGPIIESPKATSPPRPMSPPTI